MWTELGRGIRTAWAVMTYGYAFVEATKHIDWGSTIVLQRFVCKHEQHLQVLALSMN